MGFKFHAPIPPAVYKKARAVLLAEQFGWTLAYTESLDDFQLAEIFGILDGLTKARKKA